MSWKIMILFVSAGGFGTLVNGRLEFPQTPETVLRLPDIRSAGGQFGSYLSVLSEELSL